MESTTAHVIVTTTCDTPAVCQAITHALLEGNLAACVQVSAVDSHYRWEGKLTRTDEYKLAIKTRAALLPEVEATILKNHTYKVPQIIAWPITQGHAPYLNWIDETTR